MYRENTHQKKSKNLSTAAVSSSIPFNEHILCRDAKSPTAETQFPLCVTELTITMLSKVLMFKDKYFLYSMAPKASQPIHMAQQKNLFIF